MPTYVYKAREDTGKLLKGKMDAASKEELADKLRKTGAIPTEIKEVPPTLIRFKVAVNKFKAIRSSDMIMFNMQLANLVYAGLTLLTSLDIIAKQIANENFKGIIRRVHRSIAGGSSFSAALLGESKKFSPLFISMVKAGEAGGTLSLVLSRHADYLEEQEELKRKINNALYYPAILLIAGISVIVFIVSFVMPKFIEIFTKADVALPLPTQIAYVLGVGFKHYWFLVIFAVILTVMAIRWYGKTGMGRLQYDQLILKVPVLGPLARKVALSRMSRTLGNLIESGVPLLEAMDITCDVVGNQVISRELKKARKGIEKGERLAQMFTASTEFPADLIQMLSVGEETGKIDQMLYKVADYYDTVISYSVKKLITLIEPVLIILLGGMVGFIMAAMILPLFDMVKTIKH